METGIKFTYKTAFYCIRGLLSAELSSRKIVPELLIDDLFNQFENDNEILIIAKDSLERKKQKKEKQDVEEIDKERILLAIKNFIIELEDKTPESSDNREKLEILLRTYSHNLKEHFYI